MEQSNNYCNAPQAESNVNYSKEIKKIVKKIVSSCEGDEVTSHIDQPVIPDTGEIKKLLERIEDLLFPGFFGNQHLDEHSLEFHIGSEVNEIFSSLSIQISRSLRHNCKNAASICDNCIQEGQKRSFRFLKSVPSIRKVLKTDVIAAMQGDPAAKSYDEIVFSYPGLKAITIHRIAHELYNLKVPLLPRIMNEYAHTLTGIDIHPGAAIGEYFFIDHGTGIVIGETTEIGKNVRIYQGVTLGALSLPKETVDKLRWEKRHPTIKDNVIVYAGTSILGGETIIGENCVIGGNVWLTSSVPPNSTVLNKSPKPHTINNDEL